MNEPSDLDSIRRAVQECLAQSTQPGGLPRQPKKPATPAVKSRKIPYEDAVDLLKGAGVRARFDRERVQGYFDRLPSLVDEADVESDALELYLDVRDDLGAGRTVEILPPEVVRPGPAKESAPPAPAIKTRPGICNACMEFMEKASAFSPVSKQMIWEHLKEKYPDHDPASLKNTAWRAAYWSAYYYDVHVHKNAKGYWLTRDYTGDYRRLRNGRTKKGRKGRRGRKGD